jgi:DNA-binding transcriptional ArsR family regulator
MRELMDILKALADENRVRALFALQGGELCVCQLIALLGLAPSTVSKHLSILRAARLIDSRKEGRWIHYRRVPETAPSLLAALFASLETTGQAVRDRIALEKILSSDPDALCRAQTKDVTERQPSRNVGGTVLA